MAWRIWMWEGFFFNDAATTEIYTLSLHDALPISLGDLPQELRRDCGRRARQVHGRAGVSETPDRGRAVPRARDRRRDDGDARRSEEHTSELQSRQYFVCRLLLEKKTLH